MPDDVTPAPVPALSPLDEAKRTIALDRERRIIEASNALLRLQDELRFDLLAETTSERGPSGSTIVASFFRIEPRG